MKSYFHPVKNSSSPKMINQTKDQVISCSTASPKSNQRTDLRIRVTLRRSTSKILFLTSLQNSKLNPEITVWESKLRLKIRDTIRVKTSCKRKSEPYQQTFHNPSFHRTKTMSHCSCQIKPHVTLNGQPLNIPYCRQQRDRCFLALHRARRMTRADFFWMTKIFMSHIWRLKTCMTMLSEMLADLHATRNLLPWS